MSTSSATPARLERVRAGILGCGQISTLQALGYLDHPNASIVAVCDLERELAGRRQQEWQGVWRPMPEPRKRMTEPG